ncbi:hypothetical protein ACP70R_022245 [Stipagrostis hirtigluma subsp. patula]
MKKFVDLKTLCNTAAKTRRVERKNLVVPFAEPVTIDSEASNQSIPSVHQPDIPELTLQQLVWYNQRSPEGNTQLSNPGSATESSTETIANKIYLN